ncbi:MAG: serine/threonine protein kinase [Candidatus Hydrogenedentes bacterium]|nr:serine/threonine protein kinase [Candidatus Hydrogenedentota bacterium]
MLVASGLLTTPDAFLLRTLVEQAVRVYQDDALAALKAFGGLAPESDSEPMDFLILPSGDVTVAPSRMKTGLARHAHVSKEILGRYQDQDMVGHGGMGRILVVHDSHLKRDVALKELLVIAGQSGEAIPSSSNAEQEKKSRSLSYRFLREARITAGLEHPSIVSVYELGRREDGRLYYTMKLVKGETLTQSLRNASSLEQRMKLLSHFVDLCQAIAYAHSKGVIHRDIKPSNVMVGQFGETVVIDWGLARARDEKDIHADRLRQLGS